MSKTRRTAAGEALTDMIPELFRLNSRLLTAGDRLSTGLGLTSARWQVLGAIIQSTRPQPVAWIARDLGANRQNVQRIINDLARDKLIIFEANPHHRRAQLVVLTEKGRRTFEAAMQLQAPWVNKLADGVPMDDLKTAQRVMALLCEKLEAKDVKPTSTRAGSECASGAAFD